MSVHICLLLWKGSYHTVCLMSFCKQRKRENIEVHLNLNEFGYCSHCAGNSTWAKILAETLVVKITEGSACMDAIFDNEGSDA